MAKRKKYRQASLTPVGRGSNPSTKAMCPACIDRGPRRGAMATFAPANSTDRNNWWARHKDHHIPKPEEYGLRG